jgi:hypothetical protein
VCRRIQGSRANSVPIVAAAMPMLSMMSSQRVNAAKLGAPSVTTAAISAQNTIVSTNRSTDLFQGFGTNRGLLEMEGIMREM